MEYTDKINRENGTFEQLKRIADSLEVLSKSVSRFLQIDYSKNVDELKKKMAEADMQHQISEHAKMCYDLAYGPKEGEIYGSENKSNN